MGVSATKIFVLRVVVPGGGSSPEVVPRRRNAYSAHWLIQFSSITIGFPPINVVTNYKVSSLIISNSSLIQHQDQLNVQLIVQKYGKKAPDKKK